MVDIVFLEGLVISMLIGALLGLEREFSKKQEVVGLRTFSLLALFGFLSVVLSNLIGNTFIVAISFVFIAVFSILLYVTGARANKLGFTTSISIMIAFILGLFVGFGWRTEAIFLAVLISVILFSKERMHKLVSKLTPKEIGDLLEFLVLLGIVYPILPASMEIFGISVPLLMIWGVIVVISVLNFCVFIGTRYIPIRHKIELFGLLGGLINTQAIIGTLTQVYAQNKKMFQNVASGFIFVNIAMYLRNFILISIIAPPTIIYLGLPMLLILAVLVPFSRLFTIMKHREAKIKLSSPFAVLPAVKLGLAILLVFIVLDFSKTLGGDALMLTSALGGLVYSLAVNVSLGTLVMNGGISAKEAAFAFILTNMMSVVSNLFVLYIGRGRDIIVKVSKAMILSTIASVLGVAVSLLLLS
jgi:uncharacterized membrane protein (DUF4010 family)